MKIYKYRPLYDVLFKELFYQELYFASFEELNDPLDLTAGLDFSIEKVEQLEMLLDFLFRTTIDFSGQIGTIENSKNAISAIKNTEKRKELCKKLFEKIIEFQASKKIITINDMVNILLVTQDEIDFGYKIDIEKFKSEIKRLTRKFLESSSIISFSETNSNFLMWSHYSSKHTGICLEFTLSENGLFPYQWTKQREKDNDKYQEQMSEWDLKQVIFWDKIKKISYTKELPTINFYYFYPVFYNENDCDVIGLSKSKWHSYADALEKVFSTKTLPWQYEKEWRAIRVNFGKPDFIERRICHYPIECLTGIYFGSRTPKDVKNRIFKIFENKNTQIKYLNCVLSNSDELEFEEWESDYEE